MKCSSQVGSHVLVGSKAEGFVEGLGFQVFAV